MEWSRHGTSNKGAQTNPPAGTKPVSAHAQLRQDFFNTKSKYYLDHAREVCVCVCIYMYAGVVEQENGQEPLGIGTRARALARVPPSIQTPSRNTSAPGLQTRLHISIP